MLPVRDRCTDSFTIDTCEARRHDNENPLVNDEQTITFLSRCPRERTVFATFET